MLKKISVTSTSPFSFSTAAEENNIQTFLQVDDQNTTILKPI